MAFNGTEKFEKQEIIDYLESIGMRFGADLNASTSFDETVYKLQVPTEKQDFMDRGIEILREWAGNVSFDKSELELERGVVIEEWRGRRGAGARLLDIHLPRYFRGSLYAQRLPIGKKKTIESAPVSRLKKYYQDWYRPDLMAVIGVGDMAPVLIEKSIKKYFSDFERADGPRRPVEQVPSRDLAISIASDPEATATWVSLDYRHPPYTFRRVKDVELRLKGSLVGSMINMRLAEIVNQADAPFLSASARWTFPARTLAAYEFSIRVRENEIMPGFERVLKEIERVRRFGFTGTELERARASIRRGHEKALDERDKIRSATHAGRLVGHFLRENPVSSPEFDHAAMEQLLPGISLGEVNSEFKRWTGPSNRFLMISFPEKAGVRKPDTNALLAAIKNAMSLEVKPYVDEIVAGPLITALPKPGKLVKSEYLKKVGAHLWTFENGLKVISKKTSFKKDEIRLHAWRFGGLSTVELKDFPSAQLAPSIIGQSGLGEFNSTALRKKLAGKIVSVGPFMNDVLEGFSGNVSVRDLEILFKLLHLYFVHPRKDPDAYTSLMARVEESLKNRAQSPGAQFSDFATRFLSQNHPRREPWTLKRLEQVELDTVFKVFRERFDSPDGFTFSFVGNVDEEKLKSFCIKYLASVPRNSGKRKYVNHRIYPPAGVHEKFVEKGIEPKAIVRIIFWGPMKWSLQARNNMAFTRDILSLRMDEVLREEMSGVYHVSVGYSYDKLPEPHYSFEVSFSCDPERYDEIRNAALKIIRQIQEEGPGRGDYEKTRESWKRGWEVSQKRNGNWLGWIADYTINEKPLKEILNYPGRLKKISMKTVRKTALSILDRDQVITLVLLPDPQSSSLPIVNAFASSVQHEAPELSESEIDASKASDGDSETRWSSSWSDPQWIYFDLGEKRKFNKVEIHWEAAFGSDYRIEISDDAKKWESVHTTEAGDGDLDEILFDDREARYIRVYGTGRGTEWGYSIYEFKVIHSR